MPAVASIANWRKSLGRHDLGVTQRSPGNRQTEATGTRLRIDMLELAVGMRVDQQFIVHHAHHHDFVDRQRGADVDLRMRVEKIGLNRNHERQRVTRNFALRVTSIGSPIHGRRIGPGVGAGIRGDQIAAANVGVGEIRGPNSVVIAGCELQMLAGMRLAIELRSAQSRVAAA